MNEEMRNKTRARLEAVVRSRGLLDPRDNRRGAAAPVVPLWPSAPVATVPAPAAEAAGIVPAQSPSVTPMPLLVLPGVDPALGPNLAPILGQMARLPAYQQASATPVLLREQDSKLGDLHRTMRADLYRHMTTGGDAADEAVAFTLDRSIMETELSLQRVDVELLEMTNSATGFVDDLAWIERLEALRDRYVNRLVNLIRLRHQLRSPGPVNVRSSVTVQNAAENQQVQVNVGTGSEMPRVPEAK